MIVVDRQTFTDIAKRFRTLAASGGTELGHTACLAATGRALGWPSLHAAIARLERDPLILGEGPRIGGTPASRRPFLPGLRDSHAFPDRVRHRIASVARLTRHMESRPGAGPSVAPALLRAAFADGTVHARLQGRRIPLGWSALDPGVAVPLQGSPEAMPRCEADMAVACRAHFSPRPDIPYQRSWTLAIAWLKAFGEIAAEARRDAAAPLGDGGVLDLVRDRAIRLGHEARELPGMGMRERMTVGELVRLAILQHLLERGELRMRIDGTVVRLEDGVLELGMMLRGRASSVPCSEKPDHRPLDAASLPAEGAMSFETAASIIANTNTRIFMRSPDPALSSGQERHGVLALDGEAVAGVLEMIGAEEKAPSIIACTNTRLVMRTVDDETGTLSVVRAPPARTGWWPIRPGASAEPVFVLDAAVQDGACAGTPSRA